MHRGWRIHVTLALALAGAGVAGYLSWVALDSSEGLVCGAIGDCHAVQASRYSEVGGVPVAVLGLLMYLGVVVLTVGRLMTLGRPAVAQALVSPTFALAPLSACAVLRIDSGSLSLDALRNARMRWMLSTTNAVKI